MNYIRLGLGCIGGCSHAYAITKLETKQLLSKLFLNYLPYDILLSRYFNDNENDVNMLIGNDIESIYVEGHVGVIYQKRSENMTSGTNLVSNTFFR